MAVQTGRDDDSLVALKETASHRLFSKRQLHVFLLFEQEMMVCSMESPSNASPEQLFHQDFNILNSIFKGSGCSDHGIKCVNLELRSFNLFRSFTSITG